MAVTDAVLLVTLLFDVTNGHHRLRGECRTTHRTRGSVVTTNCVGAPAMPVASNTTGLPVRPVTAALTEFAPAIVPSVHDVSVAIPLAFVTTLAGLTGLIAPPPPVTVNVTVTPLTGFVPSGHEHARRRGDGRTGHGRLRDHRFAAMVVAAAAATVKLAEFTDSAGVMVVNCSVCAPVVVRARSVNVATPFTAFTVSVPLNTPCPTTSPP